MMKNMRTGLPTLFKEGSRQYSGVAQTAMKNIEAVKELAAITRTSMGPNGMNKMVINHLSKLFVTSDSATIVSEMDIAHPAAKMVVLAAAMQEKEIGDGSNFVLIFAGELCQMAEDLIDEGLHTKDIAAGFNLALKQALSILEDLIVKTVDLNVVRDDADVVDILAKSMRGAVCPRVYGYEDFFCKLIAKACTMAMPDNPLNFTVDNVRVCKVVGAQVTDSEVVPGMVIDRMVEGTVHSIENARIAVFVGSIDASSTETKGTVLLKSAEQLLDYNKGEEELMEKIIGQFAEAGVNVLVSGSNISDLAMHYIEKNKIMILKIQSKFELRRLCRSTRARPLVQLGPVSKEHLGHCARVSVKEVGARKVTMFEQNAADARLATILIRGSTQNTVDDIQRAVDDGVNTVKAMTKHAGFLPGGGAWEIELARRLQDFASQESSIAQYSIRKFADALEVIPRILAESTGMQHTEVVPELYAAHSLEQKDSPNIGIDLENDGVANMVDKSILDLYLSKKTGLKLATDAVTTILRVDQIIMAKAAGGPKMPQQQGHWDKD